jgi:DNA-binding NtrC family response regulator
MTTHPGSATSDGARPKTVLIVDDDDGMRDTLVTVLKDRYRCFTAESAEQALATLETTHVDILLTDVRLPGMDGITLVARAKADLPEVEILVLSVLSDVEVAVQAIKAGAFHYVIKDFEYETLHALLANASEKQDLRRLASSLQDQLAAQPPPVFAGGTAPSVRRVLTLVEKVAPLDTPVLITGETGTGKSLLARLVHAQSTRAGGPFIEMPIAGGHAETLEAAFMGYETGAIDGAIRRQRGKCELASGGTLVLDEVEEFPPDLQARLLRVLEEGHAERLGSRIAHAVDCRLVAATRGDLGRAVREGRFREDLYYRLNGIAIHLPPLRERPEDLPALTAHFLARLRQQGRTSVLAFTPDALEALQDYDWPGNVRELASFIDRLAALHDEPEITAQHLPIDLQQSPSLDRSEPGPGALPFAEAVTRFERQLITKALDNARGNLATAARELAMPLSTLKYKVRRYRLRASAVERGA